MTEGPFDGFLPQPSEEQIAAMREAHALQVMNIQANTHLVASMIESLDEDQLTGLDMLLIAVLDETLLNGYYRGQIMQLLKTKFGHCQCGTKHGQPETFIAADQTPLPSQMAPRIPEPEIEKTVGDPSNLDLEELAKLSEEVITTPDQELVQVDSPRYNQLCDEYGLLTILIDDNTGARTFQCVCGMIYQTLQDRMLKPVGVKGCSGCQQKAKFG
jgi:hypothetical protein